MCPLLVILTSKKTIIKARRSIKPTRVLLHQFCLFSWSTIWERVLNRLIINCLSTFILT